jgi:hypothetical protein
MSYSVFFSLGIRLLSPEFLFIGLGKDLREGLWTKRFTTMRNLTCKREHLFLLGILTGAPVNLCLSHIAVKLPLMKFIPYFMADRKNLDGNIECELVCDAISDEYVEDTTLVEHEDTMIKNNHYCRYNENIMK